MIYYVGRGKTRCGMTPYACEQILPVLHKTPLLPSNNNQSDQQSIPWSKFKRSFECADFDRRNSACSDILAITSTTTSLLETLYYHHLHLKDKEVKVLVCEDEVRIELLIKGPRW